MQRILIAFLALVLFYSGACGRDTRIRTATFPWEDGMYIGVNDTLPASPLIQVMVDIKRGRIVTIALLQHPVWTAPQEAEGLLDLVVTSQTTTGLIPRGTGSDQDQLLQAIDNALEKARSSAPALP